MHYLIAIDTRKFRMEKHVLTRPASYTKLLKHSFYVYRESFINVFFLNLILSIIVFLPSILASFNASPFVNMARFDPRNLWLILLDLVFLIFFVAILWQIHCVMFDIKDRFIEDVNVGIHKLFSVFVACLIHIVCIMAAISVIYGFQFVLFRPQPLMENTFWGAAFIGVVFGLQIIFVLYIATLFIFYVPIIATENKGIINALKRSISLSWNHWWRIISLQITPWLFYIFALVLLKFLFGVNENFFFSERKVYAFQITMIHLLLFTLFISWVASLLLTQLNDLELRKKLEMKHARG